MISNGYGRIITVSGLNSFHGRPNGSHVCASKMGAVGMTPVHATQAESLLRGRPLTPENIAACASAVKEAVDPLDDFRGSADYKRDMAEVFTRRAIEQAIQQTLENGPAA